MRTTDRLQQLVVGCCGGLALWLAAAGPAAAGQIVGVWWDGNWNCTIDGRPARMKWTIVDASNTNCSGGICSTTSGVTRKGSFSDNGSAWVPLTNARNGNEGGVFFRHADGNTWYLPKPTGNRTSGYTTWNNKRYPLVCRR